ncbi:MAG TPA: LLM class flavin-dependent oxidoreductase [Pseudonocardia sp.]|jgi:alkanesulfonate monooxygenase SsuD/methylene tetrahydromethanopterin reductase-like flavin-dependent oxidoreductase (luciferase family)|nr:LLM class flavin-dependent oxidoreductase [Pseudonocardia sp.]
MELGMFIMPAHPIGVNPFDAAQWDLQLIKWADELGFGEAWLGEHFCSPWEICPAPDLIIAQALRETERIRLAPGAHLLPFHHPAELAHRVAYLDHLAQGRLMFGIGSGGLPSDWKLFNIDGFSGQNREMTAEALEIILRIWTEPGEWTHEGKYWTVNKPGRMFEHLDFHMLPFQQPHPPIGVAGLNAPSPTLEMAGERGFIPMSLNLGREYVKAHWDSVVIGAERAGRAYPDRQQWRLAKEVFIADTDEEAYELSVNGPLGAYFRDYLLPLYSQFGFLKFFKHDPSISDSEVTAEYCAEHNWIIGSPDTAAKKLRGLSEEVGGFGTLLVLGYDYSENPAVWRRSMDLLAHEVLPQLEHA